MNLISDRLSTTSIKYLNGPISVFGRFQNGCNKGIIEPSVVHFWPEIILVISAQIALHSVQLLLLTGLHSGLLSLQINIINLNDKHVKKIIDFR